MSPDRAGGCGVPGMGCGDGAAAAGDERVMALPCAAAELARWARAEGPPARGAHARRRRVRVTPPSGGLLPWLAAQRSPQALVFRSRDAAFEVAGLCFAYVAAGRTLTRAVHAHLAALLDPDHSDMRFYGASRFDTSTPPEHQDPLWEPYGGYTFVLPGIELLREGTRVYLAANVAPEGDVERLCAALAALRQLPRGVPRALHVARPTAVENLSSFADWDAAMTRILQRIQSGTYDKIVLARRKRFFFAPDAAPDVLAVVAALDVPPRAGRTPSAERRRRVAATGVSENAPAGENLAGSSPSVEIESPAARGAYLFCLQLRPGHAFVGCTPERLFRIDEKRVLTQALAGTVRRGEPGEEGANIAELCNSKNMNEHAFVVDYAQERLEEAGLAVRKVGPRVIKLPRYMHLTTDLTGYFENDSDEERPSGVSMNGFDGCTEMSRRGGMEGLTHRLLDTLHPTPAVCGLPRLETMADLPSLEHFDRGFFAGPLGWFSSSESDFCVAIRSALICDCVVTAYAGSGIVDGSESRSEWDEAELKMSAFTDMFAAEPTPAFASSDFDGNSGERPCPDGRAISGFRDKADHRKANGHSSAYPDIPGSLKSNGLQAASSLSSGTSGHSPSKKGAEYLGSVAQTNHSKSRACTLPEKLWSDSRSLAREANLNAVWGNLVIEELCRCGVEDFIVCPGSRSAPLAVAVWRSRRAKVTVVHDERGAAFMAVGYGRACGRAAAVITSSGTAVANLLPGVVEAAKDAIPLILLTADRPPELRDVGANQTINQVGIFGSYVKWFHDMPCPSSTIAARNVLSVVDHAVFMTGTNFLATEQVMSGHGGPVHVNFMFRENLAPDVEQWDRACLDSLGHRWIHGTQPLTAYNRFCNASVSRDGLAPLIHRTAHEAVGAPFMSDIVNCLRACRRVLVVVGGGIGGGREVSDRLAISRFASCQGFPVIADVSSGMRLERCCETLVPYGDLVMGSQVLCARADVDAVIQFGERITSKRVTSAICSWRNLQIHILVSPSSSRWDTSASVSHRFCGSPEEFVVQFEVAARGGLPANPSPSSVVVEGVNGFMSKHDEPVPKSKAEWLSRDIVLKGGKRLTLPLLEMLELASCRIEAILATHMQVALREELMTEPMLARALVAALPEGAALFIGNSMPIRDMDAFAGCDQLCRDVVVDANRGASGIDGVVSSGIGFAIGSGRPCVIVVGDMSFLHDLDALHTLRPEGDGGADAPSVTVVVVNNGGGGIFAMLPIARHQGVFSPVFDTPHGVTFSALASTFGLRYTEVRALNEIENALAPGCLSEPRHHLVEVLICGDHHKEAARRRDLNRELLDAVASCAEACEASDTASGEVNLLRG